jgi:hypothetical protein
VLLKLQGTLANSIFSLSLLFCMSQVRPPGHHAGVRQAMGFCLHNNAAVAALAAQVAGAKKVLIVDWVMYTLCFFIMFRTRPYFKCIICMFLLFIQLSC